MSGRVQRANRAVVRPQISGYRDACGTERFSIVGNDDCASDYSAQPRKLAIEHGRAARRGQVERGLTQPPEASRPAACEDGSRPHQNRVASRRVSEK
jgi:hypothetical protein